MVPCRLRQLDGGRLSRGGPLRTPPQGSCRRVERRTGSTNGDAHRTFAIDRSHERHNHRVRPFEERDLAHLAEYDFTGRNEAEIRGDWVEPLLRLLGYGLGTRHRVLRETQLQLRPPTRMIGASRLEIDFVPTVFGHRLWIIEAKRPRDDLFTDEHLGQAWSYATDPRVAVPLMVLCDGSRFTVFDVTLANWDTPVFDASKPDLPELFDELFAIIGAPRVAEAIRRRQVFRLREALEAQVDLDALDRTLHDVCQIVEEARPLVEARREEIRREARERVEARGRAAIDAAGMWGHAQHVDGPLFCSWGDIDRAVALVRRQPPPLRQREFDCIERATTRTGATHTRMWFQLRVLRMACAAKLINDESCGEYCSEVALQAARDHSSGFADNPLQAVVYRLQRLLGPLGWRIAAVSKPMLDNIAAGLAASLEVEEWLRLDGEFGITATDHYLRTARLLPVLLQARIDDWTVEGISTVADEVEALLERLPKPARLEGLQPAGDPWLDSWLTTDLLRTSSAMVLRDLTAGTTSVEVARFARELLAIVEG